MESCCLAHPHRRRFPTILREIFPNLFLVHPRVPGIAGYSFLLRRKQGNCLNPNYNRELMDARLAELESLGGVSAILVNGRHNAKPKHFPNALTDCFHPTIYLSDIDAKTYKKALPNAHSLKFKRQWIGDDLEVIPFAGYSKGGLAYRWTNSGKTYLFAGISITRIDGEWKTWRAATVTPKAFNASLAELRETPCDVLVLNSFANTEDPWFKFTPAKWKRFFDELIENPNPGKHS